MVENSNLAIKNRFVAAVFANDAQTIRELCDPEFALHHSLDLPYGGVYRGADGFLQFLQRFTQTYDIQRLEEVGLYYSDDPDLLIFEFELEAKLRNTEQPFATSILEPWRFREGRVLTIKPHYYNVPRRDP